MCLRWKNKRRGILNPVEICAAEWALVRLSQAQCNRASLVQLRLNSRVNYDNALAPLAPFLDDAGIVRLGGRLDAAHLAYSAKYPLLLHTKDPLTTVLARQIHLDLRQAGGPRAITTELNKKFWVPRLSTLFRKKAYSCIPCRKRQAKPTKQIMAPLPFFRQPSARLHPFDFTAVDVAGPFKTKVGRSEVKRWLLIFWCSTVGAVHLEMIDTMDTSSIFSHQTKAERHNCRQRNKLHGRSCSLARGTDTWNATN
jgi:hypothetical protein